MSVLVIGVGNGDRGDDGAGIELARRLCARHVEGVRVRECRGDAADLVSIWEGENQVIVVDAARSGARAGTIHRREAHRDPLPVPLGDASSHAWGLAQAIEIARALGRLPARVVVYGIEGRDFAHGRAITPAVRRAIERVEQRVREEIASWQLPS
jgi:hydrogenase maturation protease